MKPVPQFPLKRPIELEDKEYFDQQLREDPPRISELTFTNLYAWQETYDFNFSRIDEALLVISTRKNTDVFEPITPTRKKETMEKCFSLSQSPSSIRFIRVSEETAKLFQNSPGFRIEEDRDDFDYVYLSRDLCELPGNKFDGKRNFIKRFKESYDFQYRDINSRDIPACMIFLEKWCSAKDCEHREGLKHERTAIIRMLEAYERLKLKGGLIEIEGKIEALSLGEKLNRDTFVVHAEKASDNFIGLYQTINQLFSQKEAAMFTYINREQDLGVPGLRKAKESYHPALLNKKYIITYEKNNNSEI